MKFSLQVSKEDINRKGYLLSTMLWYTNINLD